jgi:hypothetical protein
MRQSLSMLVRMPSSVTYKSQRFFQRRFERLSRSQPLACMAAASEDVSDKVAANEKNAPRISSAEHVRTLLATNKYATLCTISSASRTAGFPFGAATPYAVDIQGRVICCLSNLSGHKRCVYDLPVKNSSLPRFIVLGMCMMTIVILMFK